jgi:membrane protease subunit HflK
MSENNPWGDQKIDLKLPNFSKLPKIGASLFGIIIVIILAIWIGTGFFSVKADQMAVVKRFGKIVKVVGSGLHYHLPYPIETIDRAEVTKIHRIEIGFRTIRNGQFRSVPKEALMLTGDENIVSIDLIVQYKISDIRKYLYNVVDVQKTIKDVAESAIREVSGKEKIDDLLTTGKSRIQMETLHILQTVLNEYDTGVKVVAVQLQDVEPPKAVIDSFKDVASAKEDKSRFINEAESYANEIIPRARAKAASMILEAEAYQSEKIERAKGDTARFLEVLKNYKAAPEITKKRLYLETMSKVLQDRDKLIFDSEIKNVNPFIGLDNLIGGRK